MRLAETSRVISVHDRREWWETVDSSKLSEDARYHTLVSTMEKYGRKRVLEEAGINRVTLWRFLEGKSPLKPKYIKLLLKLLSREGFEKLVTAREKLKTLGVVRDDSTIDYNLALEIFAIAKEDELLPKYPKRATLRLMVEAMSREATRFINKVRGAEGEWG